MTEPNLRLLQLNIYRSRPGMETLINDPRTRSLDILLIQEPPLSAYKTHVNHLYQPTPKEEETRKRSLIYVNKRISASSHRQVNRGHPDITAVRMWTITAQFLIFSVYIPPDGIYRTPGETSIQPVADKIQSTIRRVKQASDKPTTIIMSGDFNRHHSAWSNRQVHHRLIEQAEELVRFFQAHRFQWCLPRVIPTYWSLNQPGKTSTIDLTVTDRRERLIKCHLYHDNYGSDHRATFSEWSLKPDRVTDRKPRRAYERAAGRRSDGQCRSSRTTSRSPNPREPGTSSRTVGDLDRTRARTTCTWGKPIPVLQTVVRS